MDSEIRKKARSGDIRWPEIVRLGLELDFVTVNHSYVLSMKEARCAGCGERDLWISDCSYCADCASDAQFLVPPKRTAYNSETFEERNYGCVCTCCHG